MPAHNFYKTKSLYLIILVTLVSFFSTSCSEKKTESKDIIVDKPKPIVAASPKASDQDYVQARKIHWLDNEYTVEVDRHRDKTLPMVEDEYGNKYNDNAISLRILRKDGTEAFSRTFKKTDFVQSFHGYKYAERGALLGIVLDKVEDDKLIFAASVGSPESSSDMYVPITLVIDRMGNWSLHKSTNMDTTGIDEDEI